MSEKNRITRRFAENSGSKPQTKKSYEAKTKMHYFIYLFIIINFNFRKEKKAEVAKHLEQHASKSNTWQRNTSNQREHIKKEK